jgi:hypothetical protein
MGGLGNQLFQIFTALSYIIDHAVKIIIPYNNTAVSCVFRKTYWGRGDFLDNLSIFTNMNVKTPFKFLVFLSNLLVETHIMKKLFKTIMTDGILITN